MARVLLAQPWTYHDEGVTEHDLSQQWRNGPYALLLLATQLKNHGHDVIVVDMIRDLVSHKGSVDSLLNGFTQQIKDFQPDIIGFGFFSIHYFEVQKAVRHARGVCEKEGLKPIFIAGGIHASTEPKGTIQELGFDYAFKGEADLGIIQLADGHKPDSVQGVVSEQTDQITVGEEVHPLDSLPFPDWSLIDHSFYATPTWSRMGFRKTSSLDMIMGRGCVYKCAFCAYNALSAVRFYSPEYLAEQIEQMHTDYGATGIYFTDSTLGNNRRVLKGMCEEILRRGLQKKVEWFANIRPNQVNEELLKLMWRAGCRYLFYGFESNSQRVLDLMSKSCRVSFNYKAALLHNKLGFAYHASMLLGYPGEREEDIQESMRFLQEVKPPSVGINWYVPLPGSPDYDKLRAQGIIDTDDPNEWRRIGEVNGARVYADVKPDRFRELFKQAERLAYYELPKETKPLWSKAAWGCLAPVSSELPPSVQDKLDNDLSLDILVDTPCCSSKTDGQTTGKMTGSATGNEANPAMEAARSKASYGARPTAKPA